MFERVVMLVHKSVSRRHAHPYKRHTSLLLRQLLLLPVNVDLDIGLLERTPFEVLFVTATVYVPFPALLASGLLFTALQAFCFTRNASCITKSALLLATWSTVLPTVATL